MHLLLRIKIKTLAYQSAEMRYEENLAHAHALILKTAGASEARELLHNIRTGTLRKESRAANLAYGFLLGRSYWQMERTCHEAPDFIRVQQLAEQFSGEDKRITRQRFACWHDEAKDYLALVPPTTHATKPAEHIELRQLLPAPKAFAISIPAGVDPRQALMSALIQAISHGGARV